MAVTEHYTLPDHFVPEQNRAQVNLLRFQTHATRGQTKVQFAQNVFTFVIRGMKTVLCGERVLQINNRQFLLLSAGNVLSRERILTPEEGFCAVSLFFSQHALSDFFARYGTLLKRDTATTNDEPGMVLQRDAFLDNFVISLNLLWENRGGVANEILRLKFDELMVYLCSHHPQAVYAIRKSVDQEPTDAAIAHIVNAHINSHISVEDLAFLCHTSLSTFKRRFARIYNTSPSRWLQEQRMLLAASTLVNNHCKASDLYLDYGYEHLSSFIQSFKQVHGVTPREYQQRYMAGSGAMV